jgi:hypothetical protein
MKFFRPLTTVFLLLSFSSQAQFKLTSLSNNTSFKTDIQKIIDAYPQQFAALRGDVIETNPQTVEYASLVKPEGAEETSITRYSSNKKGVYTWQAVMLSTEDFEIAVKKYKTLFGQLKGMNIKYVVDQYTLVGKYEAPDESKKFVSSILTVSAPPSPLEKLKVEVTMQFEFPEWKVKLLVYEKEREDNERGDIND